MDSFNVRVRELDDQMRVAKNCRENAFHRLNSNGAFCEFINVYYSVITATLSILSIFLKSSYLGDTLSISATILSIALTISITYANSIKFREKAQNLKNSFTSIQKLQYQLSNIKCDDYNTLNRIEMKYTKILEEYELHIPFDYYTYLDNLNNLNYLNTHKKQYRRKTVKGYLSHKFGIYCIRLALILFPFVFIGIGLSITPDAPYTIF